MYWIATAAVVVYLFLAFVFSVGIGKTIKAGRGPGILTRDRILEELARDVHCVNFVRGRRRDTFTLIGRYDGSMSEQCKASFREKYKFWDALLKEMMKIAEADGAMDDEPDFNNNRKDAEK